MKGKLFTCLVRTREIGAAPRWRIVIDPSIQHYVLAPHLDPAKGGSRCAGTGAILDADGRKIDYP
jgi:hypothetical protein